MTDTVVIVTGAAAIHRVARAALPADATVIAADSGLDHALAIGLEPAYVVGDLDSVSRDGLDWACAHAIVERHPPAKMSTDTELALDVALRLEPRRIVLIGAGDGTRPDHTMTAIGALGRPSFSALTLVGWWGSTRFHVVHGGHDVTFDAAHGAVFSVLAMHGTARGVSITGARWDLHDTTLEPLSGLGVSNEVVAPPVTVEVVTGIVTVMIPATSDEVPHDEHQSKGRS